MPKLKRRNGHRPEYHGTVFGRPLPETKLDPSDPPTGRNRQQRRALGRRLPLRPLYQARRSPRAARSPWGQWNRQGPQTDEQARIDRRAAKAADRMAHPRPTRRQRIADLRTSYPGHGLTRREAGRAVLVVSGRA